MAWFEKDNGIRMWYEDQGQGPVIVLLHGWCMSSAIWHFQLKSLSRSFRVIAPDLRGHGRSGHSGDDCHLSVFSEDIQSLISHLNLKEALLGGWSLGAQVALQVSQHVQGRLAGLLLISATPCFTASGSFPHGLGKAEADGMAVKVRRNITRALDGFTALMFAPGELDDLFLAAQVSRILNDVTIPDTNAALVSLQSLAEADLRPLLPAIGLPAMIINGDQDAICLPEASAYLACHMSASRHVVLRGCGHAPFLTRHDEFNQVVVEYFSEVL